MIIVQANIKATENATWSSMMRPNEGTFLVRNFIY